MTKRNILDIVGNTPLLDNMALKSLNTLFGTAGYELMFVGGCVRDTIMGISPKDIDLATSATPDQMIELFQRNDIRYIETGLQHGTLTAVINSEPYEITTYRIDQETDGRHAIVGFTTSLEDDLCRRDLTMNAIAMDFIGNLVDPFGGVDDINHGNVRFVGDAEARIAEDYLRILRYFRFLGRFGSKLTMTDQTDAYQAIVKHKDGLNQISAERIWMEISKIVSGPRCTDVIHLMIQSGVWEVIDAPVGFFGAFAHAERRRIRNPASILAWFVHDSAKIKSLADRWKWSKDESGRALFITNNICSPELLDGKLDPYQKMLVDNKIPREWVYDLAALNNVDCNELKVWQIPVMPVTGKDLINVGVKPSPAMGRLLNDIKKMWIKSNYSLDKDALMSLVGF